MASIPIAATGAAGIAALAGATTWLRAHNHGRNDSCAAAASTSVSSSSSAVQPGAAVALFDGATGGMLTVSGKDRAVAVGPPARRHAGGSGAAVTAATFVVDAGGADDDEDLSLPAFPVEALFLVEAGPKGSVVLRSIG
jgi:hypothetical protein